MLKVLYIVIAIICFGIIIVTHELGHFIAARIFKVRVNEFAIGMGPTIYRREKEGKETTFSIRAFPIGGFCALEGEDEDTDDPRAFYKQNVFKKFIILIAGSCMNIITGIIAVLLIFSAASGFAGNEVTDLADGFKYGGEAGLQPGDTIFSIDGARIYYSDDFSTYMSHSRDGAVDMVVIRNGEKITLEDYPLAKEQYVIDGQTVYKYGITFNYIEGTVGSRLKYSFYSAYNFLRMVKLSFADLISGAAGMKDLTGVVGIVDTITQVGNSSATVADALVNIAYLFSFIAICIGVTNLLPIPALDGGRVFLMFVTKIISLITKKEVNPKIENYIHGVGMVLLILLMVVVMYNDIVRIVTR